MTVTAAAGAGRPARVLRRRVRLRHLRAHQHRAAGRASAAAGIEFVIARHEQAAAHAADGYARAAGKPGVLLLHVGPGMMNAVTGVATAALDSVPLVAIAGDVPSYYDGRHPHQEVNLHADADQTAIYRPFVKRAWHAHRVEDLPRFPERAFWTATSGRPGAVLLNVPMDLFSRPRRRRAGSRLPAAGRRRAARRSSRRPPRRIAEAAGRRRASADLPRRRPARPAGRARRCSPWPSTSTSRSCTR